METERRRLAITVVSKSEIGLHRGRRTLMNTSTMPRKKQMVPRSFSLREKNNSVFRAPIMSVSPDRKRI